MSPRSTASTQAAPAAAAAMPYVPNREPLAPTAFLKLPIGCIRARGWMAEQLRLQSKGLTGHLDRLFADVGPSSAWLGGNGENWERGPYYARGLTALAYATGDAGLIAKARTWLDWSIEHQRDDGDFGPSSNTDWWPKMVMLQAIQTHFEATGDERVLPFMTRYFACQHKRVPNQPLQSWAHHRGGDNLDSIVWLYNRTGERFLLELAATINAQTYDWTANLDRDVPIDMHVVNLSQGYKQPGLVYQLSHEPRHRDAVLRGLDYAMKYHGQIEGLHSGDEPTAGRAGTRGTELCAVVEYMLSMHTLLRILGEPSLADRLERVAFNALPTMVAPDWRSHQYFMQPNQVYCTKGPHGFATDHGDDLTFGVLAGFPCCAVNMHMGWPQLVQNLWMATPDGGLAAIVYTSCEVTARVAGGTTVTIAEDTDYPFRDRVRFVVRPQAEIEFPLVLRVPGWCRRAMIEVNGQPGPTAAAGTFVRIERTWKPGDTVTLSLPMELRTSTWESNSVGIERGPLVFAFAVTEDWKKFPDWRRNNAQDDFPMWEVHPKTPWNYGIRVNRDRPEASIELQESDVTEQPWTPQSAPLRCIAQGRRIPGWGLDEHRNAACPPVSPVTSGEKLEDIVLLPLGATRLRLAYIPVLKD